VVTSAAACLLGLPTIGLVVEAEPSEPGWWIILALCLAGTAGFARASFARVVVDASGVRVTGGLRSRWFAWDSIDRFDLSPWARKARLITKDGKGHRLHIGEESTAEALSTRVSDAEGLVAELNALLPNTASRP
jgi:hypothetical protein